MCTVHVYNFHFSLLRKFSVFLICTLVSWKQILCLSIRFSSISCPLSISHSYTITQFFLCDAQVAQCTRIDHHFHSLFLPNPMALICSRKIKTNLPFLWNRHNWFGHSDFDRSTISFYLQTNKTRKQKTGKSSECVRAQRIAILFSCVSWKLIWTVITVFTWFLLHEFHS